VAEVGKTFNGAKFAVFVVHRLVSQFYQKLLSRIEFEMLVRAN